MDKKIIIYILGWVLIVEAIAMQTGTITSLIYNESNWIYFVIVGVPSALVGFVLIKVMKTKNMVLYQKSRLCRNGTELDFAFACGMSAVLDKRRNSVIYRRFL